MTRLVIALLALAFVAGAAGAGAVAGAGFAGFTAPSPLGFRGPLVEALTAAEG